MPPISCAILQSWKKILTHLTTVVHFTPNYGNSQDSFRTSELAVTPVTSLFFVSTDLKFVYGNPGAAYL